LSGGFASGERRIDQHMQYKAITYMYVGLTDPFSEAIRDSLSVGRQPV